jgi:hypothetical protein
MLPLRGESLIAAWELAAQQRYLERALTLLRLSCPDIDGEQALSMPISELNLRLLRLRQISFGGTVSAILPCSRCGERLEMELPLSPLIARLEAGARAATTAWMEEDGEYVARQLRAGDLLQAEAEPDPERARQLLLARCLEAKHAGEVAGTLPAIPQSAKALRLLEELNAGAEIVVGISCPSCGGAEDVELDIVRFLWAEVRHAAMRLLREVHELAATYGWSEAAILAMSPQRRTAYLQMVHG